MSFQWCKKEQPYTVSSKNGVVNTTYKQKVVHLISYFPLHSNLLIASPAMEGYLSKFFARENHSFRVSLLQYGK